MQPILSLLLQLVVSLLVDCWVLVSKTSLHEAIVGVAIAACSGGKSIA